MSKSQLRWPIIIWLSVTNKRFRFLLKSTLLYALNHFSDCRGDGASDVLLFQANYLDKIFKNKANI